MNIFGSDLSMRDTWNPAGNRTDASVNHVNQAGSVNPASSAASNSSLQAGQVFQGEILNITSEQVTIRLDNQQVLNARLGESMELNIGQRMFFEVKENQGDQVFIRPAQNGNISGQSLAAEKALLANGFSLSERNYQIASALMEAGMSLNKASMRQIMQQTMNFPEASIKNLVSMNQLGIPATAGNIEQFGLYSNHEHQMTSAMNQTLDGLEASLQEFTQNASLEDLQNLSRQLIKTFGWGEDADQTGQTVNSALTGEETVGEGGLKDTETLTEGALKDTGALAEGKGEAAGIGQMPQNMDIPGQNAGIGQMEQPAAQGVMTEKGTSGIDSELAEQIRGELTELQVPEEQIDQIMNQSKNYGELVQNLTNYFSNSANLQGNVTAEAAKQLFQSDGFRKLLRKGIRNEWLMKPEEMKDPKEIDELYQKILHQSAELEQSLNSDGSGGRQFSEQAGRMRENIQFMQQLNEQFVYAQVPMNMSGQEANSELFVYANKKKLMQNPDGVKVLLHLDMPNLGSTDILVRLKDNKLHAKFTMADNTSVSVIADHMEDLSKKLTEKGFSFSNEVLRAEGKQTEQRQETMPDAVVDEMFNQDLVTGVKRFTFDIRG